MAKPLQISEFEAKFNTRRKYYPDGKGGWILAQEMFFEKGVFNPAGNEAHVSQKHNKLVVDSDFNYVVMVTLREMGFTSFDVIPERYLREARRKAGLFCELIPHDDEVIDGSDEGKAEQNARRARRRAIGNVYDLFNSNPDLNMFVTLTFNAECVERDNYAEIYKKVSNWLDNRVKRADLKYILIPEYHADGVNIHFHGAMNESALSLVNSGVRRGGKTVYNIADFRAGFTTAIRLTGEDRVVRVARYMLKYITKAYDGGDKIGGRYYLHGGKLAKPRFEYSNEPFPTEDADHVFTPVPGVACCVRRKI